MDRSKTFPCPKLHPRRLLFLTTPRAFQHSGSIGGAKGCFSFVSLRGALLRSPLLSKALLLWLVAPLPFGCATDGYPGFLKQHLALACFKGAAFLLLLFQFFKLFDGLGVCAYLLDDDGSTNISPLFFRDLTVNRKPWLVPINAYRGKPPEVRTWFVSETIFVGPPASRD